MTYKRDRRRAELLVADTFNVPPHLVGAGPRRRTWRLRRWYRITVRRVRRRPPETRNEPSRGQHAG